MKHLAHLIVVASALAVVSPASTAPPDEVQRAPSAWRVGVRGGVAAYLNAQSFLPQQFLQPTVRLQGRYVVDRRLAVGLDLAGVIGNSDGYTWLGGAVAMDLSLFEGFGFVAAFGVASSPPGFATDLVAEADLAPYLRLGLEGRFQIAGPVYGAAFIASEQFAVASVGLGIDIAL